MKDIVVFGKPKGFESYDFEFGNSLSTIKENAHIEPLLKPKQQHNAILHYFVKDGYVCFEYYKHAKGFESDRDGSVFGIGIKTDKDLNLSDTLNKAFKPFGKELASILLDDTDKFVTQSMINDLKKTEWSQEEIQIINSTINNTPFRKTNKDLLLLVVPDYSELKTIESQVKEYSDVYIADNQDVFKDSINELLLKKSKNRIFTIKGGKIAQLIEVSNFGKEKTSLNIPDQIPKGQVNQMLDENEVENEKNLRTTSKQKGYWITHNKRLIVYIILGLIVLAIEGRSFYSIQSIKIDIQRIESELKNIKAQVNSQAIERNDQTNRGTVIEKPSATVSVNQANTYPPNETQLLKIANNLGTDKTDVSIKVNETIQFCANIDVTWDTSSVGNNLSFVPDDKKCLKVTSQKEGGPYIIKVKSTSTNEEKDITIRVKK